MSIEHALRKTEHRIRAIKRRCRCNTFDVWLTGVRDALSGATDNVPVAQVSRGNVNSLIGLWDTPSNRRWLSMLDQAIREEEL